MIDETFLVVRFESDRNRGSYSDGLESESLTIQFWNPNCLSLIESLSQLTVKRQKTICIRFLDVRILDNCPDVLMAVNRRATT